MYKVILNFNRWALNEKRIDINEILENIPIKDKANGSIVLMKNDDPWIDYINLSMDDLQKLIKYIDELKCKDITIKIQYKEKNYNLLCMYNI